MKLHNFFIERSIDEGLVGKELNVSDASLAHQLKNVFRFGEGDGLVLLDNSGFKYFSKIVSFGKDEVIFHIERREKGVGIAAPEIILFQSIIKKDKFEWIVEKGTELGVGAFVPVLSERSEKKEINADRLKKIIKEASEQSGRVVMPELREQIDLTELFTGTAQISYLVFDPKGESFTSDKIKNMKGGIGLLIGPEGGWSEKELEMFAERKIPICSLGSQILRTETAAISILALLFLGK